MKCQTQPEKQPPRKRPLWHIHGPTTTRGPRPQIPVLLGPEPVVREAPATPKAVSFQPIIPDPPSASRPSEPSLLRERTVSEPCCHGLGCTFDRQIDPSSRGDCSVPGHLVPSPHDLAIAFLSDRDPVLRYSRLDIEPQ
jgi:hypothetical protein